jgi:hypothetical protein
MLVREMHLNLLRKLAWSFHFTTGMDREELFSEASLAYCEAMQNYDSKKGRSSTYMWNCVKSHLLNVVKRENKYRLPLHSLENMEIYSHDFSLFEFIPIFHKKDIGEAIQKALQDEKATQRKLKLKYGWSDFVIHQAITDMKILTIFQDENKKNTSMFYGALSTT